MNGGGCWDGKGAGRMFNLRQRVLFASAMLLAMGVISAPVVRGQGYGNWGDSGFTDAQLRVARADAALRDAQAALDAARAQYQDVARALQGAQDRAAADRKRSNDAHAVAVSAAKAADDAGRALDEATRARDEQARHAADASAAAEALRQRVLDTLRRGAPDYQSALDAELIAQQQFETE